LVICLFMLWMIYALFVIWFILLGFCFTCYCVLLLCVDLLLMVVYCFLVSCLLWVAYAGFSLGRLLILVFLLKLLIDVLVWLVGYAGGVCVGCFCLFGWYLF